MAVERSYTVVLIPEPGVGGFSVSVPALPEIATQGETEEEAMANAREAISLVVSDRAQRGEDIPPSDVEARASNELQSPSDGSRTCREHGGFPVRRSSQRYCAHNSRFCVRKESHVRLRGRTGELVTIPKTRETLKPKTFASALRQAGLTVEGLRRLL